MATVNTDKLKEGMEKILIEFHTEYPDVLITAINIDSDGKVLSIDTNANSEKSDVSAPTSEPVTSDEPVVENKTGGGNDMFSETSSINGSFLNNRMNKHLRRSMFGGGANSGSDTLASVTELQQKMPSYKYGSQNGGGLSNADFMKKMNDNGISSNSTSDFCG
jgi:hypothetical protein